MRRCVLLPALALLACGGPDRETFLSEANAVCRDRAASQEALAGLPRVELLPAQTQVYEQSLAQLRALEPPDDYRDAHEEWVVAATAEASAWKRYASGPENARARQRVLEAYEESSAVAQRMGLSACDS
jgi:hypothetical protein